MRDPSIADDLYRARSRRLARRPLEQPYATGIPAMAGYVTTVPNVANPFISMNPVTIGGDEVEGGPFTRDVSSDTLIIAGVGKKPMAGHDTIAGFFPNRWAGFVRSDPFCDDGSTTGTIQFNYCLGGFISTTMPGPSGIDVTVKCNGVLVYSGVANSGALFTFPITRTGTYLVEWSKPLFQSGSATQTVTACGGTHSFGSPVLFPDSDRVCNAMCPDYPLKKLLTGNDGQGDVTMTFQSDGSWTGSTSRSGTGITTCPGFAGPPPPADTTVSVQVDFVWVPGDSATPDNMLHVRTQICNGSYGSFPTTFYTKLSPAASTGGEIRVSQSSTRSCWPFHSTATVAVSSVGASLYPGGLTFDLTE